MFEFVDLDSNSPNADLNEFLGGPFDSDMEATDLIRRIPAWVQLTWQPTPDERARFMRKSDLHVVALRKIS